MHWHARPLPFVSLAPAVVVVLGILAATIFGTLSFTTLSKHSDEYSLHQARALGVLLAERVRVLPFDQRSVVIERAARRAGVEILMVDTYGSILVDATLRPPARSEIIAMLVNEIGFTNTQLGRVGYSATPVKSPRDISSLLVFTRAPRPPTPAVPMVTSLGLLSLLFISAAMLVAYGLARNVKADVDYVRARISAMSAREAEPAGQTIPVRSADAVGVLTNAFNELVTRFAQAEHRYKQDLVRTLSFDRDRGAFLAALSHELRTPLNAILGFTDVLLAEVDGPLSPDAVENLTIVRASGGHLAALIDDILDLSAIESGQLRLTRNHVDALDVAQTVVKEIQVTAKAKGLDLSVSGTHAMVWADQRRLRQILNNVVGNAVKFTQEGNVSVHVATGDDLTKIEVSDTGPGIAPGDQAAIFEEYRQSGEQRTRRAGTGLGLAISRRLIEMHGGQIHLASTLGHGSTFTLILPSTHREGQVQEDRNADSVSVIIKPRSAL